MEEKTSTFSKIMEVGKFVLAFILAILTLSFLKNNKVDEVLENAEKAKDAVGDKEIEVAKVEGAIEAEVKHREEIKKEFEGDLNEKTTDDKFDELKSRYKSDS